MKTKILISIAILSLLILPSCGKKEPEGTVKKIIRRWLDLSHPLYFRETSGDKTAIYRIKQTTNEIACILFDLDGVIDLKPSKNAMYMLREDKNGNAYLTRLESDRNQVTDAKLENALSLGENPHWSVSGSDGVYLVGTSPDGSYKIVAVRFSRVEPEETYRPETAKDPEISWNESVFYETSTALGTIDAADDDSIIVFEQTLDDGSGNTAPYYLKEAKGTPEKIGSDPLVELGDISPDGKKLLTVMNLNRRDELFMYDFDSGELRQITMSPMDYVTRHPAWHPGGKYFLYTTDYTTDFMEGGTKLSGEQLFLYSMASNHARRLTALEGKEMWVDFTRNGDFLLYQTTPGVPARHGEKIFENPENANVETWRMYYIQWDFEEFVTGKRDILPPEFFNMIITWTDDGSNNIGFRWGPGGEWIPPEERAR
ncbi:MAG: hypothetical protein ABIC40_00045 [bacterium]